MNTPIPNAARIFGQTGVLRADNGGRRRIGRCGHSLLARPVWMVSSAITSSTKAQPSRRILSREVNGVHL